MNKLRILVISNSFPNSLQPHRGVYIKQVVDHIRKDVDSAVICPLPWFPPLPFFKKYENWHLFGDIPRRYEWSGYDVYSPKYLTIPKLTWRLAPVLMTPGIYRRVDQLGKEKRIDLLHAHNVFPDGVAAVWIGKRMGLPVVLTATGSDINDLKEGWTLRSWQTRWALRNATAVTAVSKGLYEKVLLTGIDRERVFYIPNGVDRSKFSLQDKSLCRKRLGIAESGKLVLFVGKLREVKGLVPLVRSLAMLKDREELDFQTALVGSGPLEGQLKEIISEKGLNGRILFKGNIPHEEISGWMSASDLFCLPSLNEGMPNVVLEALSCGLPVIATEVGGIPDLVDEQSGILVPPGDPAGLAEAIAAGFKRSWNRSSISEKMRDFSWEASGERYLEVLKKSLHP